MMKFEVIPVKKIFVSFQCSFFCPVLILVLVVFRDFRKRFCKRNKIIINFSINLQWSIPCFC